MANAHPRPELVPNQNLTQRLFALPSFVLVLGLMLLWAVRDPIRHRAMIALAGIGSLIHAMNHVIEDFITNPSISSISNNILLFVLAFALLLAALWMAQPQGQTVVNESH